MKKNLYDYTKQRIAKTEEFLKESISNYNKHLLTKDIDGQRDELDDIECCSRELKVLHDLITSFDIYESASCVYESSVTFDFDEI